MSIPILRTCSHDGLSCVLWFRATGREWNELGLQLYGRWYWGEQRGLSYSVSIVNGLEQRVENPGDPLTGGLVSQMTRELPRQAPASEVCLAAIQPGTGSRTSVRNLWLRRRLHRIR